jgi:hypothetical protein
MTNKVKDYCEKLSLSLKLRGEGNEDAEEALLDELDLLWLKLSREEAQAASQWVKTNLLPSLPG